MIRNGIHVVSLHFVIQSCDVKRLGRVRKFSSQHSVHVDPAVRKKNIVSDVENILCFHHKVLC